MRDVVCSVPHSGTRTLVEHLDIGANSPRGRWLHFGFDDARLKQHRDLHLHIPVRNPVSVASSWARRGKDIDRLVEAYNSMFACLTRAHTLHQMELLPVLDGGDDSDRNECGDNMVSSYVDRINKDVIEPHAQFFKEYYGDT